jgi:menaquinol-cytochrome c reductase iron-sulfur subunit
MNVTAQGAGGIAVAMFALPTLGFAAGSAVFERAEVKWQGVGPASEIPDDTYVPKVVTEVTGVGQVGKTSIYIRRYNPDIDSERFQDFIVLSTRCMHLGCPVRYTEAARRFICPCHGGVYDFEGKVNGGPPVRPLDRFYNRVVNGELEIGPRYSVNGELRRFPSYRDPGQNINGVGQYLYPGRFTTPKL